MTRDLPHQDLVRQKARGCKREPGQSPLHRVRRALTPPRSELNLLADDVDLAEAVDGAIKKQPLHRVLGWPEKSVSAFLGRWYGGGSTTECLEAASNELLIVIEEAAPPEVLVDGIYDPHRLVIVCGCAYEILVCDQRTCRGRFMVEVRRDGRGRGMVQCPYCGALKAKRRFKKDEIAILP